MRKLLKPVSYYAAIRPANYAKEEAARAERDTARAAKQA
jgi:hypothetical protein